MKGFWFNPNGRRKDPHGSCQAHLSKFAGRHVPFDSQRLLGDGNSASASTAVSALEVEHVESVSGRIRARPTALPKVPRISGRKPLSRRRRWKLFRHGRKIRSGAVFVSRAHGRNKFLLRRSSCVAVGI